MASTHRTCFLMLSLALLAGCHTITIQFSPMKEPDASEPRAKLRVMANGWVKGIPNRGCADNRAPGAGTLYGGGFASDGYRGRSLDIPFRPSNAQPSYIAEMYVAAGKPITLVFQIGTPPQCVVARSFIPEQGKNYEADFTADYSKMICYGLFYELGEKKIPIQTSSADSCK